ncbi:MAG TPA: YbaN family protein [Usitatibacter sp.]|nr:YbaN family protein [Usitatibacter sp.]
MLAWACIVLAAAGVVLPILPTTPFLLVAAWAAPRASPRLDAWLTGHPRFGPVLRAWREERAVPTRAKRIAWALLLASWIGMALTAEAAWVPWATAPFFIAVGVFVGTRRRPRSEATAANDSRYPRQ